MLNLGMSELLIFAIIAVIVLGPDKLPTAIRSVIKWYRQVKMLVNNVQRDIERELEITEIREKMEQEIARFKEIEQQMQAKLNQIQKEVDQLDKNETGKSATSTTTTEEPAPEHTVPQVANTTTVSPIPDAQTFTTHHPAPHEQKPHPESTPVQVSLSLPENELQEHKPIEQNKKVVTV